MSDEESDDDFDYETHLLAMQVQKYYYHGFFPVGVWVIWSLLRADCYDLSGRDNASGSIALLRLLLHYKADINAISKLHETALIVACRNKRMRAIKFLLKRGARTDLVDRTGYSALRWAVIHEHVAMVKLLLRYNASVTKDCYTGQSALELARKGSTDRHAAILKELEKKLVIERQALLLELVDKQRQDAIDAIDDHPKNREATQGTDGIAAAVTVTAADYLATTTQAPSASAKSRKPRVRRASSNQKVLAVDSSRNAGRRLTIGTVFEAGVPTPVERLVEPQLEELDDSTSSRWIKVGASKWQIRERLQQQGLLVPGSAVASPPPTTVEAYDESVRELLTSDGKWQTFLARAMNAGPTGGRASQTQLTLEDLD